MNSHILSDTIIEPHVIRPTAMSITDTIDELSTPFSIAREVSSYRTALRTIKPHEILILLFAVVYILVSTIAAQHVTEWPQVVLRMGIVIAAVLLINVWADWKKGKFSIFLKTFYVVVLPPVFFKTAELISFPLHGHDFDYLFIVADRILCFGVNPTQWLYQHIPLVPAFVEYLQICYSLFYFLPLALAIELYRRSRQYEKSITDDARIMRDNPYSNQLHKAFFVVLYGFLLSYVSYFIFPSIGPRFTLHDFTAISSELPGVFATDWLRVFLDRGENILPGMSLSTTLRVVTRDAFPSGHAEVTLLTMLLAFKYRSSLRWPITILGLSLIFSTIYLRYHYVVDVLAGVVLAMVVLYSSEWLGKQMTALRDSIV
jgi:membrane-associated phospholipid phosphatase